MPMTDRVDLYDTVEVDGNTELDYLAGSLHEMNLRTVDTYTITAATQYRPDLISNLFLGSYHLGWLIAHHNDLLEPIQDFTIGRVLNIPSIEDYYKFYNRNARDV